MVTSVEPADRDDGVLGATGRRVGRVLQDGPGCCLDHHAGFALADDGQVGLAGDGHLAVVFAIEDENLPDVAACRVHAGLDRAVVGPCSDNDNVAILEMKGADAIQGHGPTIDFHCIGGADAGGDCWRRRYSQLEKSFDIGTMFFLFWGLPVADRGRFVSAGGSDEFSSSMSPASRDLVRRRQGLVLDGHARDTGKVWPPSTGNASRQRAPASLAERWRRASMSGLSSGEEAGTADRLTGNGEMRGAPPARNTRHSLGTPICPGGGSPLRDSDLGFGATETRPFVSLRISPSDRRVARPA